MHDQAKGLRDLVRERSLADPGRLYPPPRKLVIGGAKGGVGTTTVAIRLALALARLGARVVLVDADMNRADIANICGLEVRETIADVLSSRRTVHEVLVRGPAGIQVAPGNWSPHSVPDCSPPAQERLLRELDRLGRHADLLVLDVGSGLSQVVRGFWRVADRVLLTTVTDNLSIMDAYASIKVFTADADRPPVQTLVNRAPHDEAADHVHRRLATACRRFLNLELEAAGWLPEDPDSLAPPAASEPFRFDAAGPFAAAIDDLAARLLQDDELRPAVSLRSPPRAAHLVA